MIVHSHTADPFDDAPADDDQVSDSEALSLATSLFGASPVGDDSAALLAEVVAEPAPAPGPATGSLAELMGELALLAAKRQGKSCEISAEQVRPRKIGRQILFEMGGRTLAFPMSSVLEVMAVPAHVPIPFLRDWIIGAIHWRGEVLSLVDFVEFGGGKVYDAGPTPRASHQSRVIVIRSQDDTVRAGLIVPRLVGLRIVSPEQITPMAASAEFPMAYTVGMAEVDSKSVVILDVDRILADPGFLAVEYRQPSPQESVE